MTEWKLQKFNDIKYVIMAGEVNLLDKRIEIEIEFFLTELKKQIRESGKL